MDTFETCQQEETGQSYLQSAVVEAMKKYFGNIGETAQQATLNVYELVLSEVEKPLLDAVLAHTRGNQVKSAKILGISRGTLRKKMKKYGML